MTLNEFIAELVNVRDSNLGTTTPAGELEVSSLIEIKEGTHMSGGFDKKPYIASAETIYGNTRYFKTSICGNGDGTADLVLNFEFSGRLKG